MLIKQYIHRINSQVTLTSFFRICLCVQNDFLAIFFVNTILLIVLANDLYIFGASATGKSSVFCLHIHTLMISIPCGEALGDGTALNLVNCTAVVEIV